MIQKTDASCLQWFNSLPEGTTFVVSSFVIGCALIVIGSLALNSILPAVCKPCIAFGIGAFICALVIAPIPLCINCVNKKSDVEFNQEPLPRSPGSTTFVRILGKKMKAPDDSNI